MPHALHGGFDRFLVEDISGAEFHGDVETFLYQVFQDLNLDLAHDVGVYFLKAFIPDDGELGFFFFQLAQIQQHLVDITGVGQPDLIGQRGLQDGPVRAWFKAQPLAGKCPGQPGHSTDGPGIGFLDCFIAAAGVDAYLVDLFIIYALAGFDGAAGDL